MKSRLLGGLGLLLVLNLLFSFTVSAATNPPAALPEFGPQAYEVKKYYYWGDSAFSQTSRQGIDLAIDPSSVSYQSVKGTLTMDYNIIDDRKITKFVVLANGVKVDEVEPYFDRSLNPPVYKEYYYLDINVSDQYIGSEVYFQVLALRQDGRLGNNSVNEFVVAWSQETPTYKLKPLPVTDSDTHGYLADILQKLEEMKAKLNDIQKAIENLFVPKPATMARFEDAIDNLINKTPMKEMTDKMNEMNDELEKAKSQLETAGQEIKFGDEIDLVPGEGIYWQLDFTEWREQLLLFRTILNAVLWLTFFQSFQSMLTPKPNI